MQYRQLKLDMYFVQQEADPQRARQQERPNSTSVHSPDTNGSQTLPQFTSKRSRDEAERPPLLRLEILSGPSSGREVTIDDADAQVSRHALQITAGAALIGISAHDGRCPGCPGALSEGKGHQTMSSRRQAEEDTHTAKVWVSWPQSQTARLASCLVNWA